MNNINSKSFNLYRKVSKNFVLFIQGFSVSDTFLFFCRIHHRMIAAMKFATKFSSTIRLGRNRIAISRFTLRQKQNISMNLRSARMTLRTKLSEKWIGSLIGPTSSFRLRVVLSFLPKTTERWFSTVINLGKIKLGRNVIAAVLTLATYKRLTTTDPQILETLDVLTLDDMDYVIT